MKYVEKLGAVVAAWYSHPAQPWQFWWPQSGLAGGLFLGSVTTTVVCLIVL